MLTVCIFPVLKMIQIESSYSNWEDIASGVPQGSVLAPLLYSIFLCDLFYEYENNYLAKYADNTTPYIVGDNATEVLAKLFT